MPAEAAKPVTVCARWSFGARLRSRFLDCARNDTAALVDGLGAIGLRLYPGRWAGLVCCAPLGLGSCGLFHFEWFGHLVGPIMGVLCLARR
jgi:hypothetical protein